MHRSIRPQLHQIPSCPHGGIGPAELGSRGLPPIVVDFSANTNPLGPPPGISSALSAVDISRYPDPEATALRARLSERLGVSITSLIAGNGSAELIWLIALAFLDPDDRALIVGPTFGEYERACSVMGAEVVHHRAEARSHFRMDVASIRRLVSRFQPKLIFLCNPNNPTGVLLEPEWVQDLVADCDSLLVIDEAYAAFVPGHAPSVNSRTEPNVVRLRSLTKDYALTGLRLGYAVAAPGVVEALEKVRPPWSVNAMAQAAGLVCLDDPAHISRTLEALDEAKRYLFSALAKLQLHPVPSSTNFFLLEVGEATEFRRKLLERGCCVRDCTSFGLPSYVRIGVRTLPECQLLVQAVSEVLSAREVSAP